MIFTIDYSFSTWHFRLHFCEGQTTSQSELHYFCYFTIVQSLFPTVSLILRLFPTCNGSDLRVNVNEKGQVERTAKATLNTNKYTQLISFLFLFQITTNNNNSNNSRSNLAYLFVCHTLWFIFYILHFSTGSYTHILKLLI